MCGVRLDLLWSSADEAEVTRSLFAETPLEALEAAYGRIRAELKSELVGRLKDESLTVLERISLSYSSKRATAAAECRLESIAGLLNTGGA